MEKYAIYKYIPLTEDNLKKWLIVDLPKKQYENLFIWKQSHDEFDEFWPLSVQQTLSKTMNETFDITEIWYTDKTKRLLIQPKIQIIQQKLKSDIWRILKEIWVRKEEGNRVRVRWIAGSDDISIAFYKKKKNGFDININDN